MKWWTAFKDAFVRSFGVYAGLILISLIGLTLVVLGYMLVQTQEVKDPKDRIAALTVLGWIMVGLGAIVLLPLILDILIASGIDAIFD